MGMGVLQGRIGQLGPLLPDPVKRRVPGRTACRCSSRPGDDEQRTADRRTMLAMLFTVGLAAPAQAAKPAPPPKKDAYQVCMSRGAALSYQGLFHSNMHC